jgi:hypothetical protein
MNRSKFFINAAACTASIFLVGMANAQQYNHGNSTGAGSYQRPYSSPQQQYQQQQQQQYQQRQPAPVPTDSWQYKAVEIATPVVKGIRDCAAGSFAGGLGYGMGGVLAGCPAGIAGATRFSIVEKAFTPNQAY